jgi:galactose mutarotase-like enzyme
MSSYQTYTLHEPASQAQLTVIPERGGLITRWQVGGQDLLYLDEARFADPTLSVRGGIPILFPICGNLPGNTYTYQGQSFELKQHGFARELPWQVKAVDATQITLTLESNDQTLGVYPFQFQLEFTYHLVGSHLEIQQRVSNHSTETMPFSVGLHPYFLAPDKTQLEFEIPATQGWDQRTQEPVLFTGTFDLEQDEIDWGLRPLHGQTARVTDRNRSRQITLTQDAFYPLLVFWTLKGKDYYCLEPWSAPRNALNTGDSLTQLPPGETLETWVRFSGQSLPQS